MIKPAALFEDRRAGVGEDIGAAWSSGNDSVVACVLSADKVAALVVDGLTSDKYPAD